MVRSRGHTKTQHASSQTDLCQWARASSFRHQALGVLLAISGIGYLINSFATLLAPGFVAHLVPRILLPGLAELLVALWLVISA